MGWLRCQQMDFPGDKICFSVDFLSKKNGNFYNQTSTSDSGGGGGGGGVRLQSLQSWLHSLQPNFHFWFWGGGSDCSHCKVELHSLQPNFHFSFGGGGSDCSHCKVELHSLQPNFHFWFLGGDQTVVTAKVNCTHCSPTSTSHSGGEEVGLQSLHNKMQSFQFCIFSIEMKYLMHSLLIKKYFQKQN